MIPRLLKPLKSSSILIFGARGTGKSTYIASHFLNKNSVSLNLLNPEIENKYALEPQRLIAEIRSLQSKPDCVIIDEVQKLPRLLDVVHLLIEEDHIQFVLTGSSARNLKRGAANLLAGRAYVYHLFPFSYLELVEHNFDLTKALHWGLLPKVFFLESDAERAKFLQSYTLTYLNEEIRSEQIIRKLEPFRFFLPILGQVSGKVINHKKIADQIGVQIKTVQSYLQIIEDTLLGFYLPSFHNSIRKSQRLSPKFYLIDTGIKKALEGSLEQVPVPRTSVYGELFEHFLINEVYKLNHYFERGFRMSYYATKNNVEIDLILSQSNSHILIEFKSNDRIDKTEVKSFAAHAEAFQSVKSRYYISNDQSVMDLHGVHCWPWTKFLSEFRNI
jgi:predicted AAA+ superfamily ATPase